MKKSNIQLISAVLLGTIALSSCTANTGVATESTESGQMQPEQTAATTVDLSDQSVETVYGSQLPSYLNHQYYFEGQAVPLTESNFYFIDTYAELTRYAGYYYPATSEGFIDLSAAIDTTGMSEEMSQYSTYGDFYVSYSEQMLESALIINKRAAEAGVTVSDETVAQVDSVMSGIEESAAAANLSVDDYLSIYYGEGTTAESFRQTVINYYTADIYTQDYIENYEFDEDEINVPNIRYVLFEAGPTATDEEKEAAQAAANAIFDGAEGDVNTFTVDAALSYTNGEAADYGEIPVPDDGTIDPVFTEWAWDESRQENDLDVIYSENFGYFVVAYLGTTEIDEDSKNQLAVQHMSEEIKEAMESGEYEFYTTDPYEPAPTVAPATDSITEQIINAANGETEAAVPAETASMTGNKAVDILLVVLAAVGGVAIIGAAGIGIASLLKKDKKDGNKEEVTKSGEENEAEEKEDEDRP